jgi:hypothetical protein
MRAEPLGSTYGTSSFLEMVDKFVSRLAEAGGNSESWGEAGTRHQYHFFGGSNPLNGEFRRRSQSTLASRVIFWTDGEHLLGLGPADIRVGDQVWVLTGADTPVILRPSAGQRHIFLGESFVYGMMHGQALRLFPDVQDVVLE